MDDQGNWTAASYANNQVSVNRVFDSTTGQMDSSQWANLGVIQQSLSYDYDEFGNLKQQTANNSWTTGASISIENYAYDNMHRLTSSTLSVDGQSSADVVYGYDPVGSIDKKSDFSKNADGAYSYPAVDSTRSANGWAGPNAVRFVLFANNGFRTYNGFNKLIRIQVTAGTINPELDSEETVSSTVDLFYGADQLRYKQVKTVDGATTTKNLGFETPSYSIARQDPSATPFNGVNYRLESRNPIRHNHMRTLYLLSLYLITVLTFGVTAGQLPDINSFAKKDKWDNVKISPNGDYLSAVTRVDGKKVIVIFEAKSFKQLHSVSFKAFAQPGNYHWVSDDRIITEKEYLDAWQEQPLNYGEYFAVNADGRKPAYVFGYENAAKTNGKPMWGELLDILPNDERHILIVGTRMDKKREYRPNVYEVDVYKGRVKRLLTSPVSNARFLTDANHEVRFVTGSAEDHSDITLLYKDQKWLSTADLNIDNESFDPILFKGQSNKVYATYSKNGGPLGLYLFDLDSGKKQKVFQHDRVSVNGIKSAKDGVVYAVEYDPDYPSVSTIVPKHPQAKVLKKLMTRMNGFNIQIVSETADGSQKVIFAHNQFIAGDYLLYNTKSNKLVRLFNKRPWADDATAANMVPFSFTSRDGLALSAYVTLPLGADTLEQARNLPFVVKVHGGPNSTRDYLAYDAENQLYASRGIGVLQVNFRGSAGFGHNFLRKSDRHWGDKVQYDIIDGIKALIDKGVADKKRLCIAGASFGGYSALQSAIIEPDLFNCAIGVMGIYNLALAHVMGDTHKRKSGKAYLDRVIGNDAKALRAASPLFHLDKLKTPVLIIHGGKDKRVPVEHARLLKAGLEKQGIEHQMIVLEKEGHGFYKPEHREKVLRHTLAFLLKHLKVKTK